MFLAEQFVPKLPDASNKHLATEETDTEPSCVHIETKGSDIMDQVHSCTDRDKLVVHTPKELSSGVNLWGDEWEEQNGLILFRGKVYVPLDAQLWHDIVEAHHDTPVTGHSGQWKMTELVAHNYWWPGMGIILLCTSKAATSVTKQRHFQQRENSCLTASHTISGKLSWLT